MNWVEISPDLYALCQDAAKRSLNLIKWNDPQWPNGAPALDRRVQAKVGEAIVCDHVGAEVDQIFADLIRTAWDVRSPWGPRISVKSTYPAGKKLVWQPNQTSRFVEDEFEALCLVKVEGQRGYVQGWCTKDFFAENHTKAQGDSLWVDGTLYVDESLLRKPLGLVEFGRPCQTCNEPSTVFGPKGEASDMTKCWAKFPQAWRWYCAACQPRADYMLRW